MNFIGIIVTATVIWAFFYWGYKKGKKESKKETKDHLNDGAE